MNPEHNCKPDVTTKLSTMKHWNYEDFKTNSEPCENKTGTFYWCRTCQKPVLVEVKVQN